MSLVVVEDLWAEQQDFNYRTCWEINPHIPRRLEIVFDFSDSPILETPNLKSASPSAPLCFRGRQRCRCCCFYCLCSSCDMEIWFIIYLYCLMAKMCYLWYWLSSTITNSIANPDHWLVCAYRDERSEFAGIKGGYFCSVMIGPPVSKPSAPYLTH